MLYECLVYIAWVLFPLFHFIIYIVLFHLKWSWRRSLERRRGLVPNPLVFFSVALFGPVTLMSSWASDLFHLLAHCLVSKKVSVKHWYGRNVVPHAQIFLSQHLTDGSKMATDYRLFQYPTSCTSGWPETNQVQLQRKLHQLNMTCSCKKHSLKCEEMCGCILNEGSFYWRQRQWWRGPFLSVVFLLWDRGKNLLKIEMHPLPLAVDILMSFQRICVSFSSCQYKFMTSISICII